MVSVGSRAVGKGGRSQGRRTETAAGYSWADLAHSPMVATYEVTRACDLRCRHCRADAQRQCHPDELSTALSMRLIDELATFPKPPALVLTGGDPLKRPDVYELVEHAVKARLHVAMASSATPLATTAAVRRLARSGLHRLAVGLDGVDSSTHDGFRRVIGSYHKTLRIIADARRLGLAVQVNTTVGRHNAAQIAAMADQLAGLGVDAWSLCFLVPTEPGAAEQRLAGDEVEDVFRELWRQTRLQPYAIRTTAAPHYRRFLLQQQQRLAPRGNGIGRDVGGREAFDASRAVCTNDGKGMLFVGHTGEIYPSASLPISCGQFPRDSVVRVYQTAALFRALRDTGQLHGKCRSCEFNPDCGGSRARAYALTGDPLAEEPDCCYVPPRWSADPANDTHRFGTTGGRTVLE